MCGIPLFLHIFATLTTSSGTLGAKQLVVVITQATASHPILSTMVSIAFISVTI